MRIISGSLKGRSFRVPPGFPSRPTTDFAKEGLFNILGNQRDFEGMTILDLCSGTGNLTFEFISRGASQVIAVDSHPKVCRWIQKNALQFDMQNQVTVVPSDCITFLQRTHQSFDLIFADPPYEVKFHNQIKELVFQRALLQQSGLFVMEHGKQTRFDNETNYDQTRNFGNVYFSFFSWH
jgi:16S rRNA (guanine(966)-N(2))-methyltransferase RsmD